MKPQSILTTLGSLMLSALIAHAQDSAPPASETSTNAPAQPAVAEAQPAPAAETAPAAPAEAAPAAETAPAAPAEGVPAAEPAPAPAPAAPAAESSTNSIPLIVIDDTPLLDAIRNLARQANINLMIDPKVPYGQPTADGRPGVQPMVSIRWENVSAEQALTALLNNYGLQAVEDLKIKVTRITLKDPAAPDPLVTRTFQLQYAGPSNVIAAVTASLSDKRSKVVADVRTSQIVIVATEKEIVEVEKLLVQLDTKPQQVLIEAKILETTVNPKTAKGVDWTRTLGSQNVRFGNNALPGISPTPASTDPLTGEITPGTQGVIGGILGAPGVLMNDTAGSFNFNPAAAFLNADGLSAAISFLNTHNDSKVISEPRMVTLDNQKATIDVGLMFPIVNTTAGTANTTGGSQINYTNLTVSLDVTPRIAANDQVELKIVQSVLRLGPEFESRVGGQVNEVNSFFTRQANTTVLIPSAHTLVMGGLISDQNDSTNIKVPLLGDIPVLGSLFRHDSKSRNKQNMIIFITPTIVGDGDYQPATSTFLKTKSENTDDAEWSAWDSGKPRDWSKKGVKGGATKDI